ncbi:MAG: DEAD/DEAH box helicase [Thermoplasmatales archaeon]|nr:DEAD/DEAH box helicase [Thermoplasmatales archaeon]MCW6169864.1 DEAD/DEAH box helicase [Thermoplasmatales archaeon]
MTKLSELSLPQSFLDLFDGNDVELYPHQEEAIKLLDSHKNVIVSVPTASGKSLIAYYAIYKEFLKKNKSMYIVPLRALASEKYSELKKLGSQGMRVALSIGNYDETPEFIKKCDVVVCTSEKADSLFHRDPDFISEISLVVADELHLLGDSSRGSRLETFLSAIVKSSPDTMTLGLSATITNISDLCKWLNAVPVVSDFRPVSLSKGILTKSYLEIADKRIASFKEEDAVVGLCNRVVSEGGQILIFVSSRKRAEDLALKLSERIEKDKIEPVKFTANEDEMNYYDDQMQQLFSSGVAFHHAGLSNKIRELVEEKFRDRKLKVLVATPTLAAGINLPARTVLILDLSRYSNGRMEYISTTEVHQMLGRAGRPKYDRSGYGILYAANSNTEETARDYLESEPEPVISNLGQESLIRFISLALVSNGLAKSIQDISEFYDSSLFGIQNPDTDLSYNIEKSMNFLVENELVLSRNFKFYPTQFGKIVSDLYLDPITAVQLRDYLRSKDITDERSLLWLAKSPEIPSLYIRAAEREQAIVFAEIADFPLEDWDPDALNRIKLAMMLYSWIQEVPINKICSDFFIGPGDVQSKASSADWISYALSRLAGLFLPEKRRYFEILNIRIREGIKEELVHLIVLPNIGRVRARRLFNNGLLDLNSIASCDIQKLQNIPGFSKRLAETTKENATRLVQRGYS